MELQPEPSPSTETERRKVLIVGHNPDIARHRTGKSILYGAIAALHSKTQAFYAVNHAAGLLRRCQFVPVRWPALWPTSQSYVRNITVEADRLFKQSGFLARKQCKSKRKHYEKIRLYANRAAFGVR